MNQDNSNIDFNNLPEHEPNKDLWKQINSQLRADGYLKNTKLPLHTPEKQIWKQVQKALARQKLKKRIIYFSIPVLFLAAVIVWGLLLNNNDKSAEKTASKTNIVTSSTGNEKLKQGQDLKINDVLPGKVKELSTTKSKKPAITNDKHLRNKTLHKQTKNQATAFIRYVFIKDLPGLEITSVLEDASKAINDISEIHPVFDTSPTLNPNDLTANYLTLAYNNSCYNFSENNLNSGNHALNLSYDFHFRNFFLETGLSFMISQQKEKLVFLYAGEIYQGSFERVDSVVYLRSNHKLYYTHTEHIYKEIRQQASIDHSSKNYYLQTPISIGFEKRTGTFGVGIKAGNIFSIHIPGNAKPDPLSQLSYPEMELINQSPGPPNRFHMKAFTSLSLKYYLNDKYSLYIEPNLQFDISPIFQNDESLNNYFWIETGISYKL